MNNILIVLRDINHWGIKYLVSSTSERFNVVILFHHQISVEDANFLHENHVDYVIIKSNKKLIRLEKILSFFIITPKNPNFKNIRKRNIIRNPSAKNLFYRYLYLIMPKIISVDFAAKFLGRFKSDFDLFINKIRPVKVLYISRFLPNHYHACRAHILRYNVVCWLYSWDHQYKDDFLPSFFSKYLVWNNEMKMDLNRIHNVPARHQVVTGPIQFDYVEENKNAVVEDIADTNLRDFIQKHQNKYFLFLFGTGYQPALSQEIKLVEHLAQLLYNIDKSYKLLARPYPDSKYGAEPFYVLDSLPNVYVQKDLLKFNVQNASTNSVKVLSIKHSISVINLYTTMGLEASLLDKPIIQINYIPKNIEPISNKNKYLLSIHSLMKNEHLQHYLFKNEFSAVVKNDLEFINLSKTIMELPKSYDYSFNDYLRGFCNKQSNARSIEIFMEEIKNDVIDANY